MAVNDLNATVSDITEDGKGTLLIDLRAHDQRDLPSFSAGAHIDIYTGNGHIRQYSLCNDSRETHRYLIAVALAQPSRGGSEWIHTQLRQGDNIKISIPRNHFALEKSAHHSILIAAGIGITPMLAMAQELEAEGKNWELHFSARNHQQAALISTLEQFAANAQHGKVTCYFTRTENSRHISFPDIFSTADSNAHFYCCGSNGFLDDYINAATALPPAQVHYERFSSDQKAADDNDFSLVLARSGKEFHVTPGQTILDVLKANAVAINFMCAEGVCGSCEVRVLEGKPDHRDAVLSDAEKAAGDTMMVCCSGTLSKRLVLDL